MAYLCHRDAEGGETRSEYDSWGNVTRVVDQAGAVSLFHYDDKQRLQSAVDKAGHRTEFRRDESGNVIEIQDTAGQRWQRQLDAGMVQAEINPNGEATRYQYNALGLINAIADPLGRTWHFVWDHQGKLIARKDPQGHQSRFSYDAWGELTKITWPDAQVSEYRYDDNGNCIAIKHPDGKSEQFTYNGLGLLTSHTDTGGRTTRYEYNGLSQVVKRRDPSGQILRYHYDGERNLVGLANEKGERYQLEYDLNERLVKEVGFDGRIQQYGYNPAGHLISSQDLSRDGRTLLNQIDYARRPDGRLLKQTDALHQITLAEYGYDAAGRLIRANNPARELQWKYDATGRLIEEWQDKQPIAHRYNSAGERIDTRLPYGEEIGYAYAANGRFSGMTFNGESVVAMEHDAMGRELKRLLGNRLETESRYDPQGRLIAQRTGKRTQDNAFTPIAERRYHYNPFGELAQVDDSLRGSTRYHYDALDRLIQVEGPHPERFVHDPAGNILGSNETATGSPNTQIVGNRLAFYGDNHYDYDERGNRVGLARGKERRLQRHYRYGALNQLVEVTDDQSTVHFDYDALGRRIRKRTTHGQTEFLWLGDTLLSEEQKGDAEQPSTRKTYLFEPGTFKPLALVQNGAIYHYHLDHLGTPQEITGPDGKLAWAASFKAYGNLAVVHQNEIENNLRFQGQYYDAETGLHYNRFRYYDPGCGRFINQDPIGLRGGLNNYQYVPNPAGWVDPFGLSCKKEFPQDFSTRNTVNRSARYASERDARSLARTKIGKDPVEVEPNKWRSQDGKWQYRGKPEDLTGHSPKDSPHIHLERLNPKAGEVIENWHLRW